MRLSKDLTGFAFETDCYKAVTVRCPFLAFCGVCKRRPCALLQDPEAYLCEAGWLLKGRLRPVLCAGVMQAILQQGGHHGAALARITECAYAYVPATATPNSDADTAAE